MTAAVVAMTLYSAHSWWAWFVVGANAVVGAWALGAHRWPALRHRLLWWCTGVAQVAVFVQVILGVALLQGRDTEPLEMHIFYGFVAAISVALIYSYRGQLSEKIYLLYGLGGLFVMGLAIRTMFL